MSRADPPWPDEAASDGTDGVAASDGTDPLEERTGRRLLRLSTPFVVLAILCFSTAALTVALTAEAVSNDLAILGVQVLAVGVLLRLLEYATGDCLLEALVKASRSVWTGLGRAGAWVRSRRAAVRTDGSDRQGFLPVEDVRQTVRLAAVLTFVGGALLALRWWVDPRFVTSSIYLGGWLIGVGTLVAVYAALSVDR